MRRGIHDAGLFEGRLRNGSQHYRLRARYGERQVEIEDPYRFPPVLSDFDLYLLGEGTHMNLYDKLGAHPMASVQPSMDASSNSSARRRCCLGVGIGAWPTHRSAARHSDCD
jgi:hypothetical protein